MNDYLQIPQQSSGMPNTAKFVCIIKCSFFVISFCNLGFFEAQFIIGYLDYVFIHIWLMTVICNMHQSMKIFCVKKLVDHEYE